MGCRSDYLAPTNKEKAMRDAAIYQCRVLERLGRPVPAWLKKEAKNIYASDERNVVGLCTILSALSKKDRDRLLYSDAKDAQMRDVAAWWEEHEAADKKRLAEERKATKQEKLREQALAKLTPAERKALGF